MDKHSTIFKEGLREGDIEKLRLAGKGDLHSHSGLGMRFSTFNRWAGGEVTPPPKSMNGIAGLDDYIFGETVHYIKDGKGIEFLIDETIKEAISDGVKILETSIDCSNTRFFNHRDEMFSLIKKLKDKYKGEIDFRPELGMPKPISREAMDKLLVPCIDSGVFMSLDLYGDEGIDDFERFVDYYKYARDKGLKLKVHAGEFNGPDNVRRAIEILDVNEIQHGIGAATDEYVMDMIKERGTRLNLCPSSNLILGSVKSLKDYGAKKLFHKGIDITINTDDLLLFDSGVSEEYLRLFNNGIFTEDELDKIRLNSIA